MVCGYIVGGEKVLARASSSQSTKSATDMFNDPLDISVYQWTTLSVGKSPHPVVRRQTSGLHQVIEFFVASVSAKT